MHSREIQKIIYYLKEIFPLPFFLPLFGNFLFCRCLPCHINTNTHPASVAHTSHTIGSPKPTCLVLHAFFLPVTCFSKIPVFLYLVILALRLQSWFLARLLVHSSTSTALWWVSASAPLRGAGEAGFKRWSVPSSSPDPPLLIASRMNLLHDFPLFSYAPSSSVFIYLSLCVVDEITLDPKPVE